MKVFGYKKTKNRIVKCYKNAVMYKTKLVLPLTSVLFVGCTTLKKTSHSERVMNNDYCITTMTADYNTIKPFNGSNDSLAANAILLKGKLTDKEIVVAKATGTFAVVNELFAAYNDTISTGQINRLMLKQQLLEQRLQIKAAFDELIAEVDCESERTKRAAGYLDKYEKKRNNQLTLGGILAGAAGTAAPMAINNQKTQNGVVIGASVLAAYFGIKLLFLGHKKIEFTYSRNLLADLLYAPQVSTQYPDFIWQLINSKELSTSAEQNSLQQSINKRWKSAELNGAKQETIDLIFKSGGNFTEDDLLTRSILLEQFSASLRLLGSDVQSCLSSIQKKTDAIK